MVIKEHLVPSSQDVMRIKSHHIHEAAKVVHRTFLVNTKLVLHQHGSHVHVLFSRQTPAQPAHTGPLSVNFNVLRQGVVLQDGDGGLCWELTRTVHSAGR